MPRRSGAGSAPWAVTATTIPVTSHAGKTALYAPQEVLTLAAPVQQVSAEVAAVRAASTREGQDFLRPVLAGILRMAGF
jgi:hypothetical protein